jgi:hypothetical protein
MLKKILFIVVLVGSWLALILGASPKLYYKLLGANLIRSYDYYGDLYRFSNLKQFKQATIECKRPFWGKDSSLKQNVALYTVGDSFLETWRINENDFDYKKYTTIHWYQDNQRVILDKTKTNVLLLECVERHSRERFGIVPPNYKVVRYWNEGMVYSGGRKKQLLQFWANIKAACFTPETNDHLEHLFFTADWLLPIKEWKAWFNLAVFDRVNPSAGISKDRKHIFYYRDTDASQINSSYNPLADSEIDLMVANVDSTVKAYKNAGFDHVIVNIIPNKASILAPNDGPYNHLVERWEAKAMGKFPVVSIYEEYKKNKNRVFGLNETHWTCYGKSIWLNKVNAQISTLMK